MAVAIDIETAPAEGAEFDPSDVKTGNLKDPEKIEAKIEAARAEFERSAALHWTTGRVTCVGFCGDGPGEAFSYHDERELLETAMGIIVAHDCIVTWNGYDFDMQFLAMRCLANGVQPVRGMRGRKYPLPTDKHIDIMQWYTDCGKWIGLDKAAKAILGKGKTGTGADAIQLWADGKIDELQEYCLADCALTLELYNKVKEIY